MAQEDASGTRTILVTLVPVVTVAAIGYGAWLGIKVVELTGTVAGLSEKMTRVDDGLRDIGVRISEYEVIRDREMAVVFTNPEESGIEWQLTLHVFDYAEGLVFSQVMVVPDLRYKEYVMANAMLAGLDPIPFTILQEWAEEAGNLVQVPSYIDAHLSFVSRRRVRDYTNTLLSRIGGERLC